MNLNDVLRAHSHRIVVVLPAYNASKTLRMTLDEVPEGVVDELILVDDASSDDTTELARKLGLTVVRHPVNRGYGGNQKTCYDTALASGASIVVMLHPDNQYNPRIIPNMILPLLLDQADAVLASRFISDPLKGGPVSGGMPLHKYFLNRWLTTAENWLMGTFFSEFHTGYRAFSGDCLRNMDYSGLSEDFAFDNEILAVLVEQKRRIAQVAVETRYFEEASSIRLIPGMIYAWKCLRVGWNFFLHRKGFRRWDWHLRAARKTPPATQPQKS